MTAHGASWDVAVVGAGPAGAAAALSAVRARPGARVLLLDRSDFPRDKACGDGIAPHALDVLARLGVRGTEAGHAPVHRLHLGFPGAGAEVAGDMARPAHVVPREVFDARIVAAALAAGAEFRRARVRGARPGRDGVVLALDEGEVAARVVVAADGAGSEVRRSLGVAGPRRGHLAVAIRGYAPVLPGLETEQRIVFGSGDWPAYAWSFPVGDGSANVGYGELLRGGRALSRAHLLARLDALLPGAGAGGGRWRGHQLPLSSGRPRQPPGRVLLAGDALSLINPMTGEGIYYAVLSGALAGEVAARGGAGDHGSAYRARLRRILAPHFRDTATAARLAGVPGVVGAGLRSAGRDPRVFDDLVELGLGRGRLTARALAGIARHLAPVPAGRRP